MMFYILSKSPGRTDAKYRERYIRENRVTANLAPVDFDISEEQRRPVVRFFDTQARKKQIDKAANKAWRQIQLERKADYFNPCVFM